MSFLFIFNSKQCWTQEKVDSTEGFVAINYDNCKYGLKNKKGEWVLQANFDFIQPVHYKVKFFLVEKDNLRGLADKKGNFVLNIEYENIELPRSKHDKMILEKFSFADVFIVEKGGKKGLYNVNSNSSILKVKYQSIDLDGPYVTFEDERNKEGIADSNGLVLKPKFEGLYVYTRNIIKYKTKCNNNDCYGIINKKGKTIVEAKYNDFYFVNRLNTSLLFALRYNGNDQVMDILNEKGKKLHQFVNSSINYMLENEFNSAGTYKFSTPDSNYIINIQGKIIYRSKTDNVRHINIHSNFTNLSHIVTFNDLNYAYNNQGKLLLNLGYESLELLKCGCEPYSYDFNSCKFIFKARKEGKYGVITTNDSVVFPFIFDNIYISSQNLYLINNNTINALSLLDFKPTTIEYRFNGKLWVYSESKFLDNGYFDFENSMCGITDNNQKILLRPFYNIRENEDGNKLFFSSKGHKSGYVDIEGNIHYNDQQHYNNVTPLSINRFIVETSESLLGITDSNFNVILEPNFKGISEIVESNKIWTMFNDDCDTCNNEENEYYETEAQYQLYDLNGNLLNESIFYKASNFIKNRAIVSQNGLFCILDENGKELLPYEYNQILMQDSSCFFLLKNNEWTLADWDLKPMSPFKFKSISLLMGNSFLFKNEDDAIGFYRLNGQLVNDCISYFNQTNSNAFDSLDLDTVKECFYWFSDRYDNYNITNYYVLDTLENEHFVNLLKNKLASLVLENLLIENGNYFNYKEMVEMNYPVIYDDLNEDWGDGRECISNDVSVVYTDQNLVSFLNQYSTCYIPPRGMGHCDIHFDFFNYQYLNDSLHLLKLGDLFINDYTAILKKAFIKAYEALEINSENCKNLNSIIDSESISFIIEENGLTIYTLNDIMDIDMIEDFEVTIPYSELKEIIPSNSVLFRFLK
jgi:hypothetical protein